MTEKPSNIDPAASAAGAGNDRPVSPASSTGAAPSQPAFAEPRSGKNKKGAKGLWVALGVSVLLTATLAAGLWYQHREVNRLGRELASRVDGMAETLAEPVGQLAAGPAT